MLDLKKNSLLEIYSLFFKNIYQGKTNMDLCLGIFYMTIHIIYIILVIYISFFTYNFNNTCILFVIIYLNAVTVFLIRTCPLVLLEKKYINTTCLKTIFFYKDEKKNKKDKKNKNKKDKKDKKVFSKYHNYNLDENTLQGLLTLGLFLCIKILIMCNVN
jgi:hypothetical protein